MQLFHLFIISLSLNFQFQHASIIGFTTNFMIIKYVHFEFYIGNSVDVLKSIVNNTKTVYNRIQIGEPDDDNNVLKERGHFSGLARNRIVNLHTRLMQLRKQMKPILQSVKLTGRESNNEVLRKIAKAAQPIFPGIISGLKI